MKTILFTVSVSALFGAQALLAGPNANSHHLKQTAAAQQAAQNAANAAKAKRAAELAAQKAEEERKATALREKARKLKKTPPAEPE